MVFGIGIIIGDGNWDLHWLLGILDGELGLGIGIGDWEWGMELRIGDRILDVWIGN